MSRSAIRGRATPGGAIWPLPTGFRDFFAGLLEKRMAVQNPIACGLLRDI